jgi:predicted DsbA family dithiol-disulfide isomerase
MDIQVWADFHCPYCMIGKQRLIRALETLGIRNANVTTRSFLLNPFSLEPEGLPMADHVQLEYGGDIQQILVDFEQLDAQAKADGLDMRMGQSRYANMMDAHRLFQFAKSQGLGNPFFERAQQVLFGDGLVLSNPEVLLRVAEKTGLDRREAAAVLSSGQFRREVLADDAEARRMVIDFVPYFVADGRHHFSGDLSFQDYLDALRQAQALSEEEQG